MSTLLAGDVVGAVSIGESDLLPDLTKDFLHIDKAELTNVTLDIELTINSDFDLRAYIHSSFTHVFRFTQCSSLHSSPILFSSVSHHVAHHCL